jgi:transposase-like protein
MPFVTACNLSGTNSRRIKGALAPPLRGGPLSKDAVSRRVGRLAEDFETWRRRDLAEDRIKYLIMDGWYPKGPHRETAGARPSLPGDSR